ncbi:MATE efflux family protein [[Mycoplasma] cavipharyngis]|uniref:MATE family efflux transporter n=1 Tax=[Mycoplasma] cavipharyngis TaxID=92757 RepID=UPI003704CABE
MYIFKQIQKYFPTDQQEWKLYLAKTLPIVFGAVFFALNSFIDNFMVTSIPNAVASLGYANSWTAVVSSFFIGIGIFGSALVGQFYGAKKYQQVIEVVNFRISFSLLIAIIFALVAWIIPQPFLEVFSHDNDKAPEQTITYLRIIAITWILLAFTYNSGNLLREVAYAKASFFNTLITLLTNVSFNLIFVYATKYGAVGTAYASIISRVVALILNVAVMTKINHYLVINYFTFWKFSQAILIQFNKRLIGILIYSLAINLVVFRSSIWNDGFATLGDPNYLITGPAVLSLTLAITNLMTSSFQAINGNINFFIGTKIANNQVELALANAKKVLGINFLTALMLSLLTMILIVGFVHLPGFASGVEENVILNQKNKLSNVNQVAHEAGQYYLTTLQYTIFVAVLYNPVWMLLLTNLRIIGSGGRNNIVSIANMVTNLMQLGWLAILVYAILPIAPAIRANLPLAYLIFFASDVVKWWFYIYLRHKIKWIKNLSTEHDQLVQSKRRFI